MSPAGGDHDGASLPGFAAIRAEFPLPGPFPEAALAEAERAAGVPDGVDRVDATDLPLVTVDPVGSRDLDQAVLIERLGSGFRVHYAIADLGVTIRPGGALDAEVRRRGQTFYLPDGAIPLHPPVLSEGASSLLPGQERAAVLWTIDLDSDAEPTRVELRRALVRSVARLDYAGAQAAIEAGTPHPSIAALPELGKLRRKAAAARGAIELELPEQQVAPDGNGGWRVVIRPRLDVETWNAEISLLTGMCAANVMTGANVGVLRTLPDAPEQAVVELRRSAAALGIDWAEDADAASLLIGLDPASPATMALLDDATRLLRGAGYTAFDGVAPHVRGHAGIGAPYAHVTAPLRRLVDRFATEVCLAVTAGREVPEWVREALPELPPAMESSDRLAAQVERACIDQAEAWTLVGQVGRLFPAVVLRTNGESGGTVFLLDPPVVGKCRGDGLVEGQRITARLVEVDPAARRVTFEAAEL
nr:RNB domain-containing ribonuclease [Allokutzneria sp. NRRL B-24872]